MIVSVEISYYPLVDDFREPVNLFVNQIKDKQITIETGKMSSIITGEYSEVMNILTNTMGDLMNKYPSVFTMKISNSCFVQ